MLTGVVLAFLLRGSADTGSLGIGMDVFPEAFSFAASRVSYYPNLHLAKCDSRLCHWELGEGVMMTAALSAGSLSVSRIEAALDASREGSPRSVTQFDKTCRAIVALVDSQASSSEQASIAGSISALQGAKVELDLPEAGYSFFGGRKSGAARCGAAAPSLDMGSQP